MKKFLTKLVAIASIVTMSMGIAYAWYVFMFSGELNIGGIKPATPATSTLKFADQNDGIFKTDLVLTSTKVLYPCSLTSSGWVNDISQNVSDSADYVFKRTLYVDTNDTTTQTFKVTGISLSGTGKDDEINKSLRVMITKGDDSITFSPGKSNNDFTQTLGGISGNNRVITVLVWYEGTDDANTSANALASTGEVNIEILFETE